VGRGALFIFGRSEGPRVFVIKGEHQFEKDLLFVLIEEGLPSTLP
jgi:hypothetical protein